MKKILLILIGASLFLQADFIRDNAKEVVNDTVTCLMWQDDNASKTVGKIWTDAIDHCDDMTFAGYDDWRLPNFNELYSIGDRSKYAPAIKSSFVNVVSSNYWSSTTYANTTGGSAWVVYFDNGDGVVDDKNAGLYVRCVRDGQ